jgi:hypothetical protein
VRSASSIGDNADEGIVTIGGLVRRLAAAVFVLGVLVSGCGGGTDTDDDTSPAATASDPTVTADAPTVGTTGDDRAATIAEGIREGYIESTERERGLEATDVDVECRPAGEQEFKCVVNAVVDGNEETVEGRVTCDPDGLECNWRTE